MYAVELYKAVHYVHIHHCKVFQVILTNAVDSSAQSPEFDHWEVTGVKSSYCHACRKTCLDR